MFNPTRLTTIEQLVLRRIADGQSATFYGPAGALPKVRAEFLRHLLLRLPVPTKGQSRLNWKPWPISNAGVMLQGLRIEGSLEVRDFRREEGLPALVFRYCEIPDVLDFSHSQIARLSLVGTRFHRAVLRGAQISGTLNVSRCGAIQGQRECSIDASYTRIMGSVVAKHAKLRASAKRPLSVITATKPNFALSLAASVIGGRVELSPKFTGLGGVSLRGAVVQEDVVLNGALLIGREGDAFNAQAARIGNILFMSDGFRCKGPMSLLSASVGTTVQLEGAKIVGVQKPLRPGRGVAVNAGNLHSGGLNMNSVDIWGEVSLPGSVLLSVARFSGAKIRNRGSDMEERNALNLSGAHIHGSLTLAGLRVGMGQPTKRTYLAGAVNLQACTIDGCLDLRSTMLDNFGSGSGLSLSLRWAIVRQGFFADDVLAHPGLSFVGAEIGSYITFEGSSITTGLPGSRPGQFSGLPQSIGIEARFAKVRGTIAFASTLCTGLLDFNGAEIDGQLLFYENKLQGTPIALQGVGLHLRDDLILGTSKYLATEIIGGVNFEQAEIKGKLIWDNVRVLPQAGQSASVLNFSQIKVSNSLEAKDLTAMSPHTALILTGAHVGSLDDDLARGWGLGRGEGNLCNLKLDGFTYGRLTSVPPGTVWWRIKLLSWLRHWGPFPAFGNGGPSLWSFKHWFLTFLLRSEQSALHRPRLAWVRQRGVGDTFEPQPYRHLAKVLQAQGHDVAARKILIAEGRDKPSSKWMVIPNWLYWGCFGFGLSGVRAFVTLSLCIAIGIFGVAYAAHHGLLVETVLPVQMIRDSPQGVMPSIRALTRETRNSGEPTGTGNVVCNSISNSLYAIDLILPVIPLHQESQCDVGAAPPSGTRSPPSDKLVEEWRLLKGFYSIVGKLVTALAILTFSNVLKRSEFN